MKFLPLCLQRYVLGLAESEENCVIACVALPILAVVESLCYTNCLPPPPSVGSPWGGGAGWQILTTAPGFVGLPTTERGLVVYGFEIVVDLESQSVVGRGGVIHP